MIKRAVLALFRAVGYAPVRIESTPGSEPGVISVPDDFSDREAATYRAVAEFTMGTPERVQALVAATQYLVERGVSGAFVECGVWRGGSMMAVARTLRELGESERDLYLFDTFAGMTEPTAEDVMRVGGVPAADLLASHDRASRLWAVASLDEVKHNLSTTGYDEQRLHYVEGPVEETVPAQAPEEIALLRLDTDWYQSTKHELLHLYPRLVPGGILVLDDYGHWSGARQAVDEYIDEHQLELLLHRIDVTARIAHKPG